MDEATAERVLRCVEQVPPGRVVAYGDVAGIVGIVARHVGLVMNRHGHTVTWWRVVNRDGELPPHLLAAALPHWADEGIAVSPTGRGCAIAAHRADLDRLTHDYVEAVADLYE